MQYDSSTFPCQSKFLGNWMTSVWYAFSFSIQRISIYIFFFINKIFLIFNVLPFAYFHNLKGNGMTIMSQIFEILHKSLRHFNCFDLMYYLKMYVYFWNYTCFVQTIITCRVYVYSFSCIRRVRHMRASKNNPKLFLMTFQRCVN